MEITGHQNITYLYEKEDKVQCFAVAQCGRYLEKMLPAEPADVTIEFQKKAGDGLQWDGFRLQAAQDRILITAGESRGFLYGIYHLLELCGCDFTLPIRDRQIIPKLKRVCLEERCYLENPCIQHRGMCLYSVYKDTVAQTLEVIDWMAKNRYNFLLTAVCRPDDTVGEYHAIKWLEVQDSLEEETGKRGMLLDFSEHSTDYFFPREKLFAEHPDWFSEIGGRRQPLQICYSNEEAVDYYCRQYLDFLDWHPEVKMIGVWPLDGAGYCECEACRKDEYTVIRAMDNLARKVKKAHPEVIVEHLAYKKESFAVPEWELPDNLAVLCCDRQDGVAYDWAKKVGGKGGAYYFEYNTGDAYRACANVILNPSYCEEIINQFANFGYRGIVSLFLPIQNWYPAALNYFYLRKAYWNVCFDHAEATRELCGRLYGAENCEKMKKAHELLTEKIMKPALWTKFPFRANKQWHEDVEERRDSLDRVRRTQFLGYVGQLDEILAGVDTSVMTKAQADNFEALRSYAEYQKHYYLNVDQFDPGRPEQFELQGFFKFVEAREKQRQLGGIPVAYAKWRLDGWSRALGVFPEEES